MGKSFRLTLSEPSLGTSIIPVLTDTGAVATAINTGGFNDNTGAASRLGTATADGATDPHAFPLISEAQFVGAATSTDFVQLVTATVTTANTDSLVSGNDLFVQGCPFTSMQNQAKMIPEQEYLEIFHSECHIDFANGNNNPVYRRSDDPANQNLYAASTDTAAWAAQSYCFMRGSNMVYPCQTTNDNSGADIKGATTATASDVGTISRDASSPLGLAGTPHPFSFIDNLGPYKITTSDSSTLVIADPTFSLHWTAALYGGNMGNEYRVITDTDTNAEGDVLLINGRRYKVAAPQPTTTGTHGGITLSETFAGSEYLELCSSCVTAVADGADSASALTISANWGFGFDLKAGEQVMVGQSTHFDALMSISNDYSSIGTAGAAAGTAGVALNAASSAGASYTGATVANGATGFSAPAQTGASALYKVLNTNGYRPILVTESARQTTYQYVSQCSNRGACDGSTGICACFKGYTNDNCDTQNMLAA